MWKYMNLNRNFFLAKELSPSWLGITNLTVNSIYKISIKLESGLVVPTPLFHAFEIWMQKSLCVKISKTSINIFFNTGITSCLEKVQFGCWLNVHQELQLFCRVLLKEPVNITASFATFLPVSEAYGSCYGNGVGGGRINLLQNK